MYDIQITSLKDLGFDESFNANHQELDLTSHAVARVIAEYKGAYKVRSIGGEYMAKITGKQLFRAISREDYPAVGDFVLIQELSGQLAVISQVLPRKTVLRKRYSNQDARQLIATNVDTAFVVGSPDRDFNLNRFERYFVLVKDGGINPVIIINKTDLISKEELNSKISQIKDRLSGIEVLLTNTVSETGSDELENYLVRAKTYCFLGSSGVGKSSLINRLLGRNDIKTMQISETSGRGQHTTSARQIYFLTNGAIVIDNPGTKEVGMSDTAVGVEDVFSEINLMAKNCRYTDCTHTSEPYCAIVEAVESGELDKHQYDNYIKLRKESEFYRLTDVEKRAKDKKFGKFIKKVKSDLEKY